MALIRAVVFDYGDTLVVRKRIDDKILRKGILRSFRVYKANGMAASKSKFLELDTEVFGAFAQLESRQRRDIPDEIKYVALSRILFPGLAATRRRRIAVEANAAFWGAVADGHRLRPGARSALARLQVMGIRMAVVSNHHNAGALREHLKALGISVFFSPVIASSEHPYRKPAPKIFRSCLADLGVDPGESFFVGDSLANDVGGASGVGMRTVWVKKRGLRTVAMEGVRPDYTVRDLRRIPEIIYRANKSGR